MRVKKFHPKDEIHSSHISVTFDYVYAYMRPMGFTRPPGRITKLYHNGSMHRIIRHAVTMAERNKISLVAIIHDSFDRNLDTY